jgi:DNA-3-methyladenine glycosylase II
MFLLLRLTKFRSFRNLSTMPATRSRSKAAGGGVDQQPVPGPPKVGGKRKATSDEMAEPSDENPAPQKKTRTGKQISPAASSQPVGSTVVSSDPGPIPAFVPAELSFSFEEAKQHLVAADPRFQDVFDTAVCTPYQKLDRVEPFR